MFLFFFLDKKKKTRRAGEKFQQEKVIRNLYNMFLEHEEKERNGAKIQKKKNSSG